MAGSHTRLKPRFQASVTIVVAGHQTTNRQDAKLARSM
jgi:hypothetical protein